MIATKVFVTTFVGPCVILLLAFSLYQTTSAGCCRVRRTHTQQLNMCALKNISIFPNAPLVIVSGPPTQILQQSAHIPAELFLALVAGHEQNLERLSCGHRKEQRARYNATSYARQRQRSNILAGRDPRISGYPGENANASGVW